MTLESKLIVIMIDGISSNYFIEFPQFMPHTHALANNGIVMTDLAPEKCGSSLPGRASILTGEPSRNHGIYGNKIWDPQEKSFRYAHPDDIRTPTLFTHAKKSGMDTANIGFGMTRVEDCSLYVPPHWVGEFISRNRDNQAIPISDGWRKALAVVDDGRIEQARSKISAAHHKRNMFSDSPIMKEFMNDQRMIQLVNEMVNSSRPPDVIFSEINVTDSVQHQYGYASDSSNFSIAFADMLVGSVVHNLRNSGLDSEYSIIVTSDHGHADTEKALFVNNILIDDNWNSECAILFLENNSKVDDSVSALKSYGAHLLDDSFLPKDIRGQILPLAMKDKISFEVAAPTNPAKSGDSKYKSSHSYYPGTQSDNRFAVIHRPGSRSRHIEQATGNQLYDLMTEILGMTH